MVESEFGKGFIYNLVLFTNHFSNDMAKLVGEYAMFVNMPESKREIAFSENPPGDHQWGFNKQVKWWYEKIIPIWGSPEKALSEQITLWANGATDHLYELEIPEQFEGTKIGKMVTELRDKGLSMGHGFKDKIYTMDDFMELQKLTKKIALEIDKYFKVNTIEATYE